MEEVKEKKDFTKKRTKIINEVTKEPEVVNPLRNERVIVRHIPKETAMVHDPKHVLGGGMANGAVKIYTVPMLSSGQLVNVLTNSEKEYLENIMGLEYNALSIYKKGYDSDGNPLNFWANFGVRLGKEDNYLDLSVPDDYIKYKVLLANKDLIAPSIDELQNRPKATYEFVIIREMDEEKASIKRINYNKEAYKEFGKIETDAPKLRAIIETITGRPMSNNTKIELLADKVDRLIQADAKLFVSVAQDPLLDTKVLIKQAVDAGIILNRSGLFYLASSGEPLCNSGDATLSVAANYLNEPKNQELKFTIEAKVKQ